MLKPLPGKLTSQVFENKSLNIRPAVVYGIELPLEPFKLQGSDVNTSVRLDRIRFGVAGWRDLIGREFRFPVNPRPGYIDGSMYLTGAHCPADVTRIQFGELAENRLPAEIDIRFDFEFEGPRELGRPSYTWQVILDVDPKALDRVEEEFKR